MSLMTICWTRLWTSITFFNHLFNHSLICRSGDEDEDEEPENCAAPLTCKEKDLLRYYYYIHNGIATKYVAGEHWKLDRKLWD